MRWVVGVEIVMQQDSAIGGPGRHRRRAVRRRRPDAATPFSPHTTGFGRVIVAAPGSHDPGQKGDRGTIVQSMTPNGAHLGMPRTMDEATSNLPAPDEVRAQLERMIASDDFNRSPQLGAFLRFVVEAVLQGKSDRIKATRLRRTIDRYYAGLGADDAIRIDMPRGSYIPTFSRRPALPGVTAHSSTLDRFWSMRLLLVAAVALIVIAVVVALSQRRVPAPGVAAAPPGTAQPTAAALPPGNGLPVLMMPPFAVSGTPGPRSMAAGSLQE